MCEILLCSWITTKTQSEFVKTLIFFWSFWFQLTGGKGNQSTAFTSRLCLSPIPKSSQCIVTQLCLLGRLHM